MAVPEEIQKQVLAESTSATPNFSIDYNDERFQKVENEYQQDSTELSNTYNDMINSTQGYYDNLSDKMQQQADSLAQIQKDNTDFAIEKIEQQKEQAEKDYIKEQSGAYVDWRKQSNQYGAEAEKMASAGLANTGYSESSQVSMYNTYQNRVAMARDSLERAKLNYDNNIKEAMLQNNAALAEIYSNLYIEQAKLSLEGFQYKNQLVLELADKKTELKNMKWQKELAVLEQMNTENAMKWDVTKYYDTQKWQTEQNEIERQHKEKLLSIENDYQLKRDEINNKFTADQNALNRKHEIELEGIKDKYAKEQLKIRQQNEMEQLKSKHEYKLAQLDKELANDKALLAEQKKYSSAAITGGSSSKSGSKSSSNTGSSTRSTGATRTITGTNKSTNTTTSISTNSGNKTKTTGKAKPIPVFSDKKQAETYLRKNYNVSSASLYSFSEWSRRKNGGDTSTLIKAASSYGEYLQLHCAYLIEQYAR